MKKKEPITLKEELKFIQKLYSCGNLCSVNVEQRQIDVLKKVYRDLKRLGEILDSQENIR